MSHGIRVWGSNGKVMLDTTLTTWNYITSGYVEPNGSANGDLADFALSEAIVMEFLVNDSPSDQEGYAHSISVSPSGYYIGGGNQRAVFIVLGR